MPKVYSRLLPLLNEKSTRDMKKYTQADLARALDVSPATISRWMKSNEDIGVVSLNMAAKISKWLGCSVNDLIVIDDSADQAAERAS